MNLKTISVSELGMIAGTRAALGSGIGLLLADKLPKDQRHAVGWTLVALGIISTFPLAAEVLFRKTNENGKMAQPQEVAEPNLAA